MIRVLALAWMVRNNHIPSSVLFNACGQDDSYVDLINILNQIRPMDGDIRTVVSIRLKAGIKPNDIRTVDGVEYTELQMYRMKHSSRFPDTIIDGKYLHHNPGWYQEMAKKFFHLVLSNIQLPRVYYGEISTELKLYVLYLLRSEPTFIRMIQEVPEYREFWEELRCMDSITPGTLKPLDYPNNSQFYRMIGVPKGNTPASYKSTPEQTKILVDIANRYDTIISELFSSIMSLQCQGYLNEELMDNGGDNFEYI